MMSPAAHVWPLPANGGAEWGFYAVGLREVTSDEVEEEDLYVLLLLQPAGVWRGKCAHRCNNVSLPRKSFPLGTKTLTKGSTSASSAGTWRSTRRSWSSHSRVWTKTTTVKWSPGSWLQLRVQRDQVKRTAGVICLFISPPPSGRIDHMEIKQSLANLGLNITKEEAEKILQR